MKLKVKKVCFGGDEGPGFDQVKKVMNLKVKKACFGGGRITNNK
jgi:hypothetical protein